ncbi:unnamed protein product [Camellia sinensis]
MESNNNSYVGPLDSAGRNHDPLQKLFIILKNWLLNAGSATWMAKCNRAMLLRQLLCMITLAEGPCTMRVPGAMLEMQSRHASSNSQGLQHLASPLASTGIDHHLLPNFLIDAGDAVMARWLQFIKLQHLASPLASTGVNHRLLSNLLMQGMEDEGRLIE